jgi:D-amino peptidase
MRVYVSVDIEGITGVVHRDMMMPGEHEYNRGRRLMMGDANAAIDGLVKAGATTIVVADGHGPMRNLLIEDLHPAAQLVTGTADGRDYCQLETADAQPFDAAVFVGYHAMARTYKAIAPHTIAGAAVSELRVNGKPHGETGLNAAVLGSLGIPVIMLTGDSTTCAEAKAFLGDDLATVAVKDAVGRNAALCRPPASTHPEITATAERALSNRTNWRPYTPDAPYQLEVDFVTMVQCDRAARTPGVERLSPMTIRVLGTTPWEQYGNLWTALRASLYEPASFLS